MMIGEVVRNILRDPNTSKWYFDRGTNAHISSYKDCLLRFKGWKVVTGIKLKAEGFGTVMILTKIDEHSVYLMMDSVLYIPGAECYLLSLDWLLIEGVQFNGIQKRVYFVWRRPSWRWFALIMKIDYGSSKHTILSSLSARNIRNGKDRRRLFVTIICCYGWRRRSKRLAWASM